MMPTIDVAKWINQQKLSKLQIWVIIVSGACTMVEGFDALNIGFVAPAVVAAVPSLIAVIAVLVLMRLEPAKAAARRPIHA
jgi:hypothetical protein